MNVPQQLREQPWITYLTITACVFVHIGLSFEQNLVSNKTLAQYGVLTADRIWHGAYWSLVTSAFVHIESWHLLFNLYWLWTLGRYLEHAIGSWRYLVFYILAAAVGSSYQLAFSGQTGIGASGVVYGIFGFMWVARSHYTYFYDVVNQQTVQLMNVWLVVCIVATNLDLLHIANAAHVSGLLFGVVTGAAFYDQAWLVKARAGMALLIVGAAVPLFWAPWSVSWLGMKAYDAHEAKRYDEALDLYTRLLRLDPDNEFAHHNRGMIYEHFGETEKAIADWTKAGLIPDHEEATELDEMTDENPSLLNAPSESNGTAPDEKNPSN